MSDKNSGRSSRKRRSTASRGSLKRFATVDHVKVEMPFSMSVPQDTEKLPSQVKAELGNNKNGDNLRAGDGCYISATVHNRRYYGILLDQASLKTAQALYFQDEALSLDLNRRIEMKLLEKKGQSKKEEDAEKIDQGSSIGQSEYLQEAKRQKTETPDTITSANQSPHTPTTGSRPIQKLRYIKPPSGPGYRVLLATYLDTLAASEDNTAKAAEIEKACQDGGNYVGDYYYQYEALLSTLKCTKHDDKISNVGFRTSMGLPSFLRDTALPEWFPLSNLECGQHKVLSMLNLKKNSKGGMSVEWDAKSEPLRGTGSQHAGTAIPMEPRSCFRVGVVGAGIAGLACAVELFRLAARDQLDLEVILLEGRSRVGGRLLTDTTSFSDEAGKPFPVDLGASWIHGIDHNPLAALAKEAGIEFVTASEEVKMLGSNMQKVDEQTDERMGKLFDSILDKAADDTWTKDDYTSEDKRAQKAVRWYASTLSTMESSSTNSSSRAVPKPLIRTDAPAHRHSSDVTIDHAMGNAISNNKTREFSKLSDVEQSLLLWNAKNLEYALGANVSDLSMKFWDSDERHAFEGDHVLLKEGYTAVTNHLMKALEKNGEKFKCVLDFPVDKIEYSRKSMCQPYLNNTVRRFRTIELSDVCCVSSRNQDEKYKFDFTVCTLPLGVLKESISKSEGKKSSENKVEFVPTLPHPKIDAIENVGFGLLNKVYLQFPHAFWRIPSILEKDQTLFGNATGLNPHHYMFFDIGKSLGGNDGPPILMTLISGQEAAESEQLTDEELTRDVVATVRKIFSNISVPNPVASKATRWGADPFSRGCYTFLPPGASDQDFQILQSPINGNGDSLLLEGNEIMRLFWAGEHTTALHPSMAHGAMLSGIRAAKEVFAAIRAGGSQEEVGTDKLIPLSIFRKINPHIPLNCGLCHLVGTRVREGSLFAFQRGSRQVLVHNNCAENCPEVEVKNGKWKNVIKAVNRGKQVHCTLCSKPGGTVGCTYSTCFRSYHFSCCEDTGWRFQRDGKVYSCDLHRSPSFYQKASGCDQISIRFFKSVHPSVPLTCSLCGILGDNPRCGKIVAFQQNRRQLLLHQNCIKHTTIVETVPEDSVEGINEFQNVFHAIARSRICSLCGRNGATIECFDPSCRKIFHLPCADTPEWRFEKRGNRKFKCEDHRRKKTDIPTATLANASSSVVNTGTQFQHSLFQHGIPPFLKSATQVGTPASALPRVNRPSNARVDSYRLPLDTSASMNQELMQESASSDEVSDEEDEEGILTSPLLIDESILKEQYPNRTIQEVIRVERQSKGESWGMFFSVQPCAGGKEKSVLIVRTDKPNCRPSSLKNGDIVVCVHTDKDGLCHFTKLEEILDLMKTTTDLTFKVLR